MSRPAEHPLEFLARMYAHDPEGMVRDCFPWGRGPLAGAPGPDDWQAEVLGRIGESLARGGPVRLAVASGHGVGKTALMAWIVIWFTATRPHPQVVVTANTRPQLESKTWRELAKWHRLFEFAGLFEHGRDRYALRRHPRTWFAQALAWRAESAEAFAGTHERHVAMLFDEASRIDDRIWEVAEGAMTTPGALWCVFGNPTRNAGRFAECFGSLSHRWRTMRVDARSASLPDKGQIAAWIEDYGEDSDFVRVRVKGEFPGAESGSFIPRALVEAARKRRVPGAETARAPLVLGVDPARFGADCSVILARQGLAAREPERFRGLDNMTLAGMVAERMQRLDPAAVFVDAGAGAGVVDRLRQLGFAPLEVNFAGRARRPDRFANRRAEMWAGMRDWLEAGGSIPDDALLAGELEGPRYAFDAADRILLEKKSRMKARGLASPDAADALALTFAMPVAAPGHVSAPRRARLDYDIFADPCGGRP